MEVDTVVPDGHSFPSCYHTTSDTTQLCLYITPKKFHFLKDNAFYISLVIKVKHINQSDNIVLLRLQLFF